MNIPNNLKYTEDHEWIRVEGEFAYVGITDFASSELGDIVFLEVDTIDELIGKDEPFGSIEAVKTVSDLLMPVESTVVEFNEALEDAPETVNSDPYGDGWIVKVKLNDAADLDSLMDHEKYAAFIEA